MSVENHDQDAIHPEDGSEAEPKAHHHRPPDIQRAGDPDPFHLEDQDSAEKEGESHVKGLDVCPNCGSPMPDAKTLVCLRCGFDLKRLEVIKTATGEAIVEDEEDDDA